MHAIDFAAFVACEPDNVSLHVEMILIKRLHLQIRCRTLFNEQLVSVDGDGECCSSLFAKPIALK